MQRAVGTYQAEVLRDRMFKIMSMYLIKVIAASRVQRNVKPFTHRHAHRSTEMIIHVQSMLLICWILLICSSYQHFLQGLELNSKHLLFKWPGHHKKNTQVTWRNQRFILVTVAKHMAAWQIHRGWRKMNTAPLWRSCWAFAECKQWTFWKHFFKHNLWC